MNSWGVSHRRDCINGNVTASVASVHGVNRTAGEMNL